jgi:hypothetical protein
LPAHVWRPHLHGGASQAASAGPVDPCGPARAFEHADEHRRQVELAGVATVARGRPVGVVHVMPALSERQHGQGPQVSGPIVPTGGEGPAAEQVAISSLCSRPHPGTSSGGRLARGPACWLPRVGVECHAPPSGADQQGAVAVGQPAGDERLGPAAARGVPADLERAAVVAPVPDHMKYGLAR